MFPKFIYVSVKVHLRCVESDATKFEIFGFSVLQNFVSAQKHQAKIPILNNQTMFGRLLDFGSSPDHPRQNNRREEMWTIICAWQLLAVTL